MTNLSSFFSLVCAFLDEEFRNTFLRRRILFRQPRQRKKNEENQKKKPNKRTKLTLFPRSQVGITALSNAVSAYRTTAYTRRVYPGTSSSSSSSDHTKRLPPVSEITPVASRLWGTWCAAVGITRVYAAYHIHQAPWYQLAMWTNVVGLTHYSLEAAVYRTSTPSGPWLAPVTVAGIGLAWQLAQYGYYVR